MCESLINRVLDFLNEFGMPATVFCNKVNISYSTYQSWKRGKLKLSDKTQNRISDYLVKYKH